MSAASSPDLVLIDRASVPASLAEDVRVACGLARASVVEWPAPGSLDAAPLLLVGALPQGQRRVPPALLELVAQTFPGLPLLLLCAEPLVRRVVSLHGGRVNLLGPPLGSAEISRRIAALLADRRAASTRMDTLPMGLRPVNHAVVISENERALWWTATVICHGARLRVGGPMPSVRHHISTGITAFIPLSDAAPPSDAEVDRLVAAARMDRSAERLERIFSAAFGDLAGVVHLSAAADEWTIYWPRREAMLEMSSATRFPPRSDIAAGMARGGVRACRMSAVSGDVLVALSSKLPGGVDVGEAGATGPAALRLIQESLRDASATTVGVLAEVL